MKIRRPAEAKPIKANKVPRGLSPAKHDQHRQPMNKHGSRHNGPHESLNPPFEKL
jgi:hypothetical protein